MVERLMTLRDKKKRRTSLPVAAKNVPVAKDVLNRTTSSPFDSIISPLTPKVGRTPSFSGNIDRPAGVANISSLETKDRGSIFGMDPKKFAEVTGELSRVIAPETVQGRVGGALSQLARRDIAETTRKTEAAEKVEREAPGKALDREFKQLQIEGARKKLEAPRTKSEFERFQEDPESFVKFKAAGRTPVKPKLTFKEDAKGNISIFEGTELVRGSGLGKPVKDTGSFKIITDDKGRPSVFKDGVRISGPGLGKSKTVAAGKTKVDQIKKGRKEKIKHVTSQMKIFNENVSATPREKNQERKRIGTQYDAELNDWSEKFLPSGERVFVKDNGDIINETGLKVGEIDKGIPTKVVKSHK